MNRQDFREELERRYRPLDVWIDARIVLSTSGVALRSFVPFAADQEGFEGDPGPLSRWYGECNGILFSVESSASPYHQQTVLILPDPVKLGLDCMQDMLTQMKESGLLDVGAIVWIKSNPNASHSAITYDDEHGIKWEVYRAISQADAVSMYSCLQKSSPKLDYRIEAAEDTDSVWVAARIVDHCEKTIVARYTDRATTERAACSFSLSDDATFSVLREDAVGRGLSFRGGKIVVA